MVLTAKFHDGFALWPSAYSPYFNAATMGAGRDICGELSEAVRAAGLRMGFYYSLLEWRHPRYNRADIGRFVSEVVLPQMKELVSAYRPDIVWTDGEWDYPWQTWRGPEFLAWLYNESPVKETVVANDRWGKGMRGACGDHYTTEYGGMEAETQDVEALLARHPWEECRGIGHSFGYNRFETVADYLTNGQCIEELVEKCSRGGNLLLNIAPDATGLIPVVMQDRLLAIGRGLAVNGEAIYGTTAWAKRPKTMARDRVYYTQKGETVYAAPRASTCAASAPCGRSPCWATTRARSSGARRARTSRLSSRRFAWALRPANTRLHSGFRSKTQRKEQVHDKHPDTRPCARRDAGRVRRERGRRRLHLHRLGRPCGGRDGPVGIRRLRRPRPEHGHARRAFAGRAAGGARPDARRGGAD